MQQSINDILRLQDVELANAMTELKNDPAKLSDFISQRKGELYNSVSKEHSDNYEKVYGDLIRSGDTIKNITYYHVRNKDLHNLQDSILNSAENNAQAAVYDSQIAKRQFEINEWTSENKRDTLFFMQLALIGLTLVAPLLYITRIGLMPYSVFSGLSFLILVALVLTFVVRYQYTNVWRDMRFWNRRRFPQKQPPLKYSPTCEAVQGLADVAASTYSQVSDAASSTYSRVSDVVNYAKNSS